MVNNQRITVLLQQFSEGTISREDYLELISYFRKSGNDEELYSSMDELWKGTPASALHSKEEEEQLYQRLVTAPAFKENQTYARPIRLWYRLTAAAAVLILLAAGIYFLTGPHLTQQGNRFAKNDIAPGGNKAILTLSDGRVINLNDAKDGTLMEQAGIQITKTKDGELVYAVRDDAFSTTGELLTNTISTPNGGRYQVNLPDGSRVWLNAASALKFPVNFGKEERRVSLQGEAYFEIKKNRHLPFIVKTELEEIEVLGTHFNVKAYKDEPATATTLLEGAVRISFANVKLKTAVLKPGQQALVDHNQAVRITEVDTEQAVAWKNGLFMFDGQDLEGIMKEVSRWYNVEVTFMDNRIKKQAFKGAISRFKHISQLLEVLESTGSVKFKMEGRRITAM